jgi:hypothetical protein
LTDGITSSVSLGAFFLFFGEGLGSRFGFFIERWLVLLGSGFLEGRFVGWAFCSIFFFFPGGGVSKSSSPEDSGESSSSEPNRTRRFSSDNTARRLRPDDTGALSCLGSGKGFFPGFFPIPVAGFLVDLLAGFSDVVDGFFPGVVDGLS